MQAPDRGAEGGVEQGGLIARTGPGRYSEPREHFEPTSDRDALIIRRMSSTIGATDGDAWRRIVSALPHRGHPSYILLACNTGLPSCSHRYKYRLYYGLSGECRVRYDNERGKGDHRHFGEQEGEYAFVSIEQLLDDFRSDVERWG